MQTYKDRINSIITAAGEAEKTGLHPNKNHQRSLSFCNYDEFYRRPTIDSSTSFIESEEMKFRQRKPLIDEDSSIAFGKEKDATTSGQKQSSSNTINFPLLSNPTVAFDNGTTAATALLSCTTDPALNPVAAASIAANSSVKSNHRRSLSLRQRFEVGYGFIVSEFEHAREVAGKTVIQASDTVWKVCHFSHLPNWMQDNEYLHGGHRPPLPSLWACAKSIFRVHTETGNIWTHGIGALLFLGLLIYEFATISANKTVTDRLMLAIYFSGIILCLLFSTLFHTFSCYASPKVIKLFSKLDYCGISLQIIGSMTPALYYGFYENMPMFRIYITFGVILCILSIIVSMWDKFGEPKYRSLRALVFLTFGLSNVVPGIHWFFVLDSRLVTAFGLFIAQGALYVIGALLYANRIPERLLPGKCDYLFQSHQIFHVLVVLAALVHLNGINSMANFHIEHATASAGGGPVTGPSGFGGITPSSSNIFGASA